MNGINNRIREVRLDRGVGLNELARKAGISGAYLHDLEVGNRQGSNVVLQRIANELQTTVDELIQKAG